MPDTAQLNRSISTVRTELEFLRDSGVLSPQQLDSILAQLPVSTLIVTISQRNRPTDSDIAAKRSAKPVC